MDTEEDQHDLCRSHSGKFPLGSILHLVLAWPAFLGDGGLDFVLLAERSVIVSGVTLITTDYPIDEFSV